MEVILTQITTGSKKVKGVEIGGGLVGEKGGFRGSGKGIRRGIIKIDYDQNTLYTCIKLSKNNTRF